MKPRPSGSTASLRNGRMKVVSIGFSALTYRNTAAPRPNTDCQKYFQRLGRPREFFSITLR